MALGIGIAVPALAQNARITETPPMAVSVSPPPPVTTADISAQNAARQRAVPVNIRVFGGSEELWSRPLVLRGYSGAQVTLEVSEASACPRDVDGGYSSQRTGLRLQLSQRGPADRFQVNASWTRRSTDCAAPGTLTTGLDIGIELTPGQTRTVTGDGGLRVVISRPG